jgi:uncharacterized OsmC-like protein
MGTEREGRRREIVIRANVQALGGQLKRARVEGEGLGTFYIYCDEPASIGGANSAPAPLQFLAAALGFCLLTQLERYAPQHRVDLGSAEADIVARFVSDGSVLAGDIRSWCDGVEVSLQVQSKSPPGQVERLLELAERACYVTQSLLQPVPVSIRTSLNGEPLGPSGT